MNKLNVKPRTIFCRDNLDILEGLNDSCIDLIYLDPPFNKKKTFTAPIGSSAEGAEFSDIFREKDIKDAWVDEIECERPRLYGYLMGVKNFSNAYTYCYLVYMAIRLIECHRVLKDSGSAYLHCDPTMSHYLKIVMDCIFNENNFRNEIIWSYPDSPSGTKRDFPRKHDVIFRYTKGKNWTFNDDNVRIAYSDKSIERIKYAANKSTLSAKVIKLQAKGKLPTTVWSDIRQAYRYKESVGYPTQKPLALMERIIEASSNKGDVVLDPFCGCATTCIAAEKLDRDWVGVDVSHRAYEVVKERLKKEIPENLLKKEPNFSTARPKKGSDQPKKMRSVYVVSNAAWEGEFKVGISKDVKDRLRGYQTGDARRDYILEFSLETPHFKEIEKHIHNKFPCDHEWVKADLKDIIKEIKKEAKRRSKN